MDDKDKFSQDEDKNESDGLLIEKTEGVTEAETNTESETKIDSDKTLSTPRQIGKEYSEGDENSEGTKGNVSNIPSVYKEVHDGQFTSNLDASLQISAEKSATQSNPISTGNKNAKLYTGLEEKSVENTLLDNQEIEEYGPNKEDSNKPSEEIELNMSLIQKSTPKTPRKDSSLSRPSFFESSLRIISPRRSPSSGRNSCNIFISDKSPVVALGSTIPDYIASFFTPSSVTNENSNSSLRTPTAEAASVVPPLHPGNLYAHNFPHLEPPRTGISYDRTSSFTEPGHSRNFSDVSSVNRPRWFPLNESLSNRFLYNPSLPPNCSYCGCTPRYPIIHPFNNGTSHDLLFPPSALNPSFSQYGSNTSCPTIGLSSSISSTRNNLTTHNPSLPNTLTSSNCTSYSTRGFLTNPTTCFSPSGTTFTSSDEVFSPANLSKLVASTTVSSTGVSSTPVCLVNQLSASGASAVDCDISSNTERSSQESIFSALTKEVRKFFAKNPVHEKVCSPECIRPIGMSMNLRNSDERGGSLNIPPSPAAKDIQTPQRVATPKRAREDAGYSSLRYSVDGRWFASRQSSRSSSISSECSYRFRDEENGFVEACERLAVEGISEVDFLRYARTRFQERTVEREHFDSEFHDRFHTAATKLGMVYLARLYDQLNKTVVGQSEHDRRLNIELSNILEFSRRVSGGPPLRKSPKLSVHSQDQRTPSNETVRNPDFTLLTPSTSRKESNISLRTVEESKISLRAEKTASSSSITDSSIVSSLGPQSINNQLMGSSGMQSNESFNSSDPVPNGHSSEQNGSMDNVNTEEMESHEGQAALDQESRIDSPDNESGNDETVPVGRFSCNVM